jgi:hypothetical protein
MNEVKNQLFGKSRSKKGGVQEKKLTFFRITVEKTGG